MGPIYSKHHFAISAAVGALAAIALGVGPREGTALVAWAAAVGVLIDLDHFVIARINAGDWRALRFCLCHPGAALFDQSAIFEPGEVGKLQRLLSHALLGGVLVGAFALADRSLAALTGIVLYVHVVSDLISDLREPDGPA